MSEQNENPPSVRLHITPEIPKIPPGFVKQIFVIEGAAIIEDWLEENAPAEIIMIWKAYLYGGFYCDQIEYVANGTVNAGLNDDVEEMIAPALIAMGKLGYTFM